MGDTQRRSKYDKAYWVQFFLGCERDWDDRKMRDRHRQKDGDLGLQADNPAEDPLAEALDNVDAVREWVSHVKELKRRLRGRKIDVTSFFQECGSFAGNELLRMAITSKDAKIRLDALKELLDRGGNSKVTKVAIATTNIDRGAAKEELISTIRGLASKVKDLEIIDTDVDKENEDV